MRCAWATWCEHHCVRVASGRRIERSTVHLAGAARRRGLRTWCAHLEPLRAAAAAARRGLRRSGLRRGLRGWVVWRGRERARARAREERKSESESRREGEGGEVERGVAREGARRGSEAQVVEPQPTPAVPMSEAPRRHSPQHSPPSRGGSAEKNATSPSKQWTSRAASAGGSSPATAGASPKEDIASRSKQWSTRRDTALRRERAAQVYKVRTLPLHAYICQPRRAACVYIHMHLHLHMHLHMHMHMHMHMHTRSTRTHVHVVQAAKELEGCTFSPRLNAHSLRISAMAAGRPPAGMKPPIGVKPATGSPITSSTRRARPPAPATPPSPHLPAAAATYARHTDIIGFERAAVDLREEGHLASSQAQAGAHVAACAAEQLVRHRLKVLATRVQQMRVLRSAAAGLSPSKSDAGAKLT